MGTCRTNSGNQACVFSPCDRILLCRKAMGFIVCLCLSSAAAIRWSFLYQLLDLRTIRDKNDRKYWNAFRGKKREFHQKSMYF